MKKRHHIATDGYWEEISVLANQVMFGIEVAVEKDFGGEVNTNDFKQFNVNDSIGERINRVYYDDNMNEVLFDTKADKGQYLREEPINIIMYVAEQLNDL